MDIDCVGRCGLKVRDLKRFFNAFYEISVFLILTLDDNQITFNSGVTAGILDFNRDRVPIFKLCLDFDNRRSRHNRMYHEGIRFLSEPKYVFTLNLEFVGLICTNQITLSESVLDQKRPGL